ncbi:MAG: hypothetical protein KF724_09350 [Phycisphaeraceae bacterium]|nr:hypothetical protein [Phycisphaeraceae bacterium]
MVLAATIVALLISGPSSGLNSSGVDEAVKPQGAADGAIAQQGPRDEPGPNPAEARPVIADELAVRLPLDAARLLDGGPTTGRMLVFLRRPGSRARGAPIDAPFFEDPQPLFGREVESLVAGEPVVFSEESGTLSFPHSISELGGRFEAQAVFVRERTERGHLSPGNLISEVTEIDLDPERRDAITLTLTRRVPAPDALPETPGVIWEQFRSELLTRALGRETFVRAGVVLPFGYHDINWPRRQWPVIYVVPGFGGRHTMAAQIAAMNSGERARLVAPQAIWVVLDPESPLGHHLFADSEIHGPRATSLVEEFIPHLESKYRIVAAPEARIVTGHSSGGWSALWLAIDQPSTFGACFASAPDPVDFSAFQVSDLYRDSSVFVDDEGRARPSYRQPIGPEYERVLMTAEQEISMEHVLSPEGASGQQWDAWASVFGSVDASGRGVARMCDPVTGAVDRDVVERLWSRYDIVRRLDRDWARLGPVMIDRVRVLCGDRDNFYLERAVERLRDLVERRRSEVVGGGSGDGHSGGGGDRGAEGGGDRGRGEDRGSDSARGDADQPGRSHGARPEGRGGHDGRSAQKGQGGHGYVELVRGATHGSLPSQALLRWHKEMRDHFRRYGLD